jgi:virginiamycin B lyase
MHVRSLLTTALVALAATASPVAAQRGGQVTLPEGEGRDLVQAACTECHGLGQINGAAGYDAEGWRDLFTTMVALPDADEARVAQYLATHYPPREGRSGVLVPGEETIEITEWIVPTLGQRSRDAAQAPDGSIWWTGMWASLLGRLDPETGEMREYPLPPEARPHTLVPAADGFIWYTGNSNATIGRLDPATGEVTEYPTQARDPHSATFHPNGNLYFTAQGARVIGRLNPETGELTEVPTEPNPYGIQVAPDGTVWVAHNGTNKLSAVDPETMEIRYYEVPNEASRIRRLGIASDGMVWYGNATQGKIGRLNPATGEVREWDSPSGPDSNPYALTVVNDIVWYNESGMRPDILVRFDPATEEFQSWEIPSGVGIVRNFGVTSDGDLIIHQTSSNRIGIVRIGPREVADR